MTRDIAQYAIYCQCLLSWNDKKQTGVSPIYDDIPL